jgi:[protein-PII] uridylyltransferase
MSYFARHDAGDIAWHARMLFRHLSDDKPVVAARISSVGEGLQVLVYAPDRPDVFARICGYFDRASFNIQDARIHTTASGYVLDTFQIMASDPLKFEGVHYRDLIALVENQLAEAVASEAPCINPAGGACRVASNPSPCHRASACGPTSAANAGCSASQRVTARVCSM